VLPDGGEIEGTLTLNDVARPLQIRVAEEAPGRYRGTATVVQSAHGIKPYSAFMGTLKLRDEVTLEFEVDLARAQPQPA
jgi:polyisoprenoid-binding protein YceI